MELVVLTLNSLGLAGLAAFLWFIWKGLRDRINALTELANEQSRTLAAVRERADEFDRLSKAYKQALADFHEMGSKVNSWRTKLVHELEQAVAQRDEQLRLIKTGQGDEQRESLKRIPALSAKIDELQAELKRQAAIVTEVDPLSPAFRSQLMASVPADLEFEEETAEKQETRQSTS